MQSSAAWLFFMFMAIILVVGCGAVEALWFWRWKVAKSSEEGGKAEAG
jgi:hypothetical protein